MRLIYFSRNITTDVPRGMRWHYFLFLASSKTYEFWLVHRTRAKARTQLAQSQNKHNTKPRAWGSFYEETRVHTRCCITTVNNNKTTSPGKRWTLHTHLKVCNTVRPVPCCLPAGFSSTDFTGPPAGSCRLPCKPKTNRSTRIAVRAYSHSGGKIQRNFGVAALKATWLWVNSSKVLYIVWEFCGLLVLRQNR